MEDWTTWASWLVILGIVLLLIWLYRRTDSEEETQEELEQHVVDELRKDED